VSLRPSRSESVCLGEGDGGFQQQMQWSTPANLQQGIVVGDFNQDGRLDIAVVDNFGWNIDVLLNTCQ
jgi:hypothetical protein